MGATGELIISVSGIRGVVGESLTPEVVARFAAAHGACRREATGGRAIVLGRDARTSGPLFVAAAEAGLRSVGCDVVHVGMACTPTILLAVRRHAAAGGIAVTASHNPAQWNALKLAGDRGIFLSPSEARAVVVRAETTGLPRAAWDELGEVSSVSDATERHVEAILADPWVDAGAIRARAPRVVLDACAGAGALAAVPLLQALGARVEGLHLEPTGRFPRDPEPVPENLGELGARVREIGAELGLAVDPDGDRLALVDDRGRPVGEDLTLALAVDYVLGRAAGEGTATGPVVTNLSTSQVVERVAERHGVPVERTAVGEVNVALRMIERGSRIGGEGNGGVMYGPLHHTRDAPVAIALILSYLSRWECSLAEAAGQLPRYAIARAKLRLDRVDADALLEKAATAFDDAAADRTDGLKLSWPDRQEWIQLRKSGTEPIVRVIAEAPDPERAEALLDRARELAPA
ncbi:MAG TPA: phosphoglucosamine mutase [Gemmatimonadota bacterium]|nr:phosphoglucosamine mutase [Gemmatimonadota bacterium]